MGIISKSDNDYEHKSNLELNALWVYSLRILGAVLTFILQIFLARWIGDYQYGLFAFTWACIIILGELLSFGFYNLVQRLIPQYRVANQLSSLRGILWGSAGIISMVTSLITVIIILSLFLLISNDYVSKEYGYLLIIGALSLPAFALSDFISGIGRSYGFMVRAFAPTALFRPLVIIGLIIGSVAFGASSNALTALICAVIAIWLTLLISFVVIRKKTPTEEVEGPRDYQFRSWIIAALPMMMISSFELLLFNVDVLMIGRYLPADQTGIYFAAAKIMGLVAFLNFAVGAAFNQSYANNYAKKDQAALAHSVQWSASLTFYSSLIVIIAVLLFKDQLLGLFGESFKAASYVIFPLSIGLLCRSLVGPGERVLMMTGHHYMCTMIYLAMVTIDIILNLILIPPLGILGAAISTSISMMLMALMLHIMIRKNLDIQSHAIGPLSFLKRLKGYKMN